MDFHFDFQKAAQAVGVLLDYERSKRMSYMRLLKLLYIADRETLKDTGTTISGDRALAMKRGPVLNQIYDLIRGEATRAGEWEQMIHTDRFEVELASKPGRGELSRKEIKKLLDVSERYRNHDEWELSEFTHGFVEWQSNYPGNDGVGRIPWTDVLAAVGRPEIAETVRRNEETRQYFDRVFGG